MSTNWSKFMTPEFGIGVLLSGLLLNVVGTYVVRGLDRFRSGWTEQARSQRERLRLRREAYTTFARTSPAAYAALAAEAARLRARSVRYLLMMVVMIAILLLIYATGDLGQGWRRIAGALGLVGLALVAMVSWILTIEDDGKRAASKRP